MVKIDDSIPMNIAVWSELLSVSYAMTRRIDFSKTKNIALFGDGIMGYITYIILTRLYKKEVTVFGIDDDKLKMFEGAKTYHFEDYVGRPFDTLIEAVGGRASGFAINNMIDLASIGADLILMGVSEENVPLCTRKVLEKGLSLKGVTRSSIDDFKAISELLSLQDVQKDLEKLILSEITIKSVNDVYKAFELDINNTKLIGKNLMKF